MAFSKHRSSLPCLNLLLTSLNLSLILAASASISTLLLLRRPPSPVGWAFFAASASSLVSAFLGFYSQLNQCLFLTHTTLLLFSLLQQGSSIFMLILRKNTCIRLLESPRTQREVKILIKAQVGFALSVFLLQIVVLGLMCAIESCIVKEFMGLETKREEMGRKRGRKVAHVRAEAMVQEAHMEEVRVREFEEKNENKYGQWVKPDFEA